MSAYLRRHRNRALLDPKSKQHRHIKTLAEKEALGLASSIGSAFCCDVEAAPASAGVANDKINAT